MLVKREEVIHHLDVVIDNHVVQKAHNQRKSLGAGAAPVVACVHRERISIPALTHLARYLAEHLNVLDASTKRKTRLTRTHIVGALWSMYPAHATAYGVPPADLVSRTYFYDNQVDGTGDPKLGAECMCDICHSCGHETWGILARLIDSIGAKFQAVRAHGPCQAL
jgi:hypothetical protein